MHPWPGAYTTAGGTQIKVLAAVVMPAAAADQLPGTLLAPREQPFPLVVTGKGLLALREVQPAGRRPMSGADWLRGAQGLRGAVLGVQDVAGS